MGLIVLAVCQVPITVAGVSVPEFASLYLAIAIAVVAYFMLSGRFREKIVHRDTCADCVIATEEHRFLRFRAVLGPGGPSPIRAPRMLGRGAANHRVI